MKKAIRGIVSILSDAILVNLGIILSFLLRYQGRLPARNFEAYLIMAPYITIIWIGSLYSFGLYRDRREASGLDLLSRTTQAAIIALVASVLATYFYRARAAAFPSTIFLISWLVNILLLSGWRFIHRIAIRPKKKRALIVGKGKDAESIKKILKEKSDLRYEILRSASKDPQKILKIIRQKGIDEVVIALPSTEHEKILDIILKCQEARVGFKVQPDLYEILMGSPHITRIEGLPLVDLLWGPISGWYEVLKRALDLLVSATMLLFLLPVILVIVCAIKIDSSGPIFYKQERIGKNKKPFLLYKFRSMIRDAEKKSGPVLATWDDPRATKIGKILRRIGLDEIPQLWSVVVGKMSLVGPRPERKVFIAEYPQIRLSIKPGLTGLAQVNVRFNLDRKEKIKYDLYYVQSPSLVLDVKILLKTAFLVLHQFRGKR
ncbi:sugar transferase [bacterium]|nr:sugar transferase [bacterium]